ncbi:hypothetical protein [Longirhabdus pacifica]|uniref:hypothetical protein n=1 Tax=Longirhabdus pacifica TaxID=2305227 RepID=UPI001008DCCC|nr:hypothetical protein [Longirhabdus pacifica]
MLSYFGKTLLFVALLSLLVVGGELYVLKAEIQGAFDRSMNVAANPVVYEETPDLQLQEGAAKARFMDYLEQNLLSGRIQNVSITSFEVVNVFKEEEVKVQNPLNNQEVVFTVDRPSAVVLGVVEVDMMFLPNEIEIPILSVSSGFSPSSS